MCVCLLVMHFPTGKQLTKIKRWPFNTFFPLISILQNTPEDYGLLARPNIPITTAGCVCQSGLESSPPTEHNCPTALKSKSNPRHYAHRVIPGLVFNLKLQNDISLMFNSSLTVIYTKTEASQRLCPSLTIFLRL